MPIPAGVLLASSLGSAALGGLTSWITGKSNKKSVDSTNQMNLQIARETNQANKDLYQQQFADQLKMWNMQSQYNSPVNEAARLRAAGLNPSMTFGSGAEASPMSVPSASPSVGATMQAPLTQYSDSWLSPIITSISSLGDISKSMEEAKGLRVDNQYRAEIIEQDLANRRQELRESMERVLNSHADRNVKSRQVEFLDSQRQHIDLTSEVLRGQKEGLIQSTELQNQQTAASIALARQQASLLHEQELTEQLSRELNIRADSRAYVELQNLISKTKAEVYGIRSQGSLNDAQIKNLAQNVLNGIQQNNLLRQQIAYNKVSMPQLFYQLLMQIRQQERDYGNPFRYLFGSGSLSAPSGAAIGLFK